MNVETIPPRKGSTVEAREAIVPNLDISATQLNSTSVGDSPKNKPTPSKGKEQHTSLPTSATESKRQSTAGEEIGLANIYRNPSSKNLSRHQSRAMLIAPSHVSEKADVNVFDDPFGERAAAAAAQPAAGREGSLRTKLLTEVQLQRIKQEQNERGLRIHEEATDLLEGYSEKRKVFQRAKELTKVMKGRADDVAEMEERNQLLRGAGGADHLVEELQAKTVGAKDAHSPSNREDYGVTDGFNVQAGEEENDTLGLESLEKVGKIQKLRSYQKSLTELDDAEEEEKRKRKRAGASQSNSNNASFYRRKNELSVQSSQVSAEELRKKFNALFGKNEERGNLPPEPPTTFTSAALGTTLEYLYRSISTIEEATNIICVTATFKSKDESATIAAPLRGLNENVAYAKACYEVLLSHLRHFESGQRALLDSGSSEVTALREQFLQKKETLTADQQKEKSLLEVRNGLKTKLLHLNKRCALWEQIFLSPGTENHLRLSYLQSRESNVSVRNMDSNRESIKPAKLINVFSLENNENSLSAYPFNEPHMEQSNGAIELPVDAMTSDAGSPSSIGNSTRAPHSTRAPKRSVTSATFSPGVVSTKKKTNYDNVSYLEQYLRSYNTMGKGAPTTTADQTGEEMDTRIAATWGNPYLDSARKTAEANKRDPTASMNLLAADNGQGSLGLSRPSLSYEGERVGSSYSKGSYDPRGRLNRVSGATVSPVDGALMPLEYMSSNNDRSVSTVHDSISLEAIAQERLTLLLQSALVPLSDGKHQKNPTKEGSEGLNELIANKSVRNSIQKLLLFLERSKKSGGSSVHF